MDHREHLPVGAELVGEYRIDGLLGSGGFGVTYKATDLGLGTVLAIKEYFPSEFGMRDGTLSITPRSERVAKIFEWGRARFLEEARTMARFDHSNIVKVFRVFEALNTAYIVLKFEAGTSLRTWLDELGRAPTQGELDNLVAPLLDALETLHSHAYIHRDIAPDNILMRPDGSPVLIDFGSARQAIAQETQTLTGIVKPGYSPPEQYIARGTRQGPWTDIYALGATLYRAISGETPLDGPDRQLDDLLQTAAVVAAADYRPDFLAAIDEMLILKPDERPQSVADLRLLVLPAVGDAAAGGAVPLMPAGQPHVQPAIAMVASTDVPNGGLSSRDDGEVTPDEKAADIAPPTSEITAPRRRGLRTILGIFLLAAAVGAGLGYYNHKERQQVAATKKKSEEASKAREQAAKARAAKARAAEARAAKERAAEAERRRIALEAKRKAEAEQQRQEEARRRAEEAQRKRQAQAKPAVPPAPSADRGWLGVQIQSVTKDIAESLGLSGQKGALVARITEGGPAARAGLRAGDVITAVDGAEVQDSKDLASKISARKPESRTTLTVIRGGKQRAIVVVLGRFPAPPKSDAKTKPKKPPATGKSPFDALPKDHPFRDLFRDFFDGNVPGLTVSDITAGLRKQYGLGTSMSGVVVTGVSGAPKHKKLQPGDVVQEVNQTATKSVADYAREVAKVRKAGRTAVLILVRDAKGDLRFVALPIGSNP